MDTAMTDAAAAQDAFISVVARKGCKYCLKAKNLLKEEGIPFEEVDVTDNIKLLSLIQEVTSHRTVPQIFIHGNFIGGATELIALFDEGKLQGVLSDGTAPGLPPALARQIQLLREEQALQREPAVEAPKVPEYLLALAEELKGKSCTERSTKSFTYTRAISGAEAMQVLLQAAGGDRTKAMGAGASLLQHGLVYPIMEECSSWFHRRNCNKSARPAEYITDSTKEWFAVKGTPVKPRTKGVALNSHYVWTGEARSAIEVSTHLRKLIENLYDQFLSKDGRGVSYRGIAESPLFQEYMDAAAELQQVNLNDMSREELLCFFINLYNALIIHAQTALGIPTSALQRAALFSKNAVYNVAGYDYTADDMEHGVMRGNAVPPGSLFSLLGLPALAQPQFKAGDPRAERVVRPVDPRIHFALVCGAKSCPPVQLYEPFNLEDGLQGAAEAFCSSEVKVDVPSRTVTSSMILKWYGSDFGATTSERLKRLLPFVTKPTRADLEALLASPTADSDIKWQFTPYDWTVNSSDN